MCEAITKDDDVDRDLFLISTVAIINAHKFNINAGLYS